METTVHAIFRGRVQGVNFRMETFLRARDFGVKGWIRNLPDGTVEAVFSGEENAVSELISYCRTGIRKAFVESYTGEKIENQHFHDFSIR